MLTKENIKIQKSVYNISPLVKKKRVYMCACVMHIYYVYYIYYACMYICMWKSARMHNKLLKMVNGHSWVVDLG